MLARVTYETLGKDAADLDPVDPEVSDVFDLSLIEQVRFARIYQKRFFADVNQDFEIISNDKNKLTISYEKSKLKIDEIISYLLKQDAKILDISTDDADIEDVYIELIKN